MYVWEKDLSGQPFLFWTYVQLRHFPNDPLSRSDFSRQHTQLELLCTNTEPQRHLISTIYSILFAEHNPKSNTASAKWEKDLSINLSEDDWEKIYSYIHTQGNNQCFGPGKWL